ncbi:MAG: DUF1730 domain-containing protein [Oscillospiraceae bacterium]|nr:DUF1730 domain-containing protein [Oscillospiraceae bacterium]
MTAADRVVMAALEKAGIRRAGVCRFADVLPLIPCRAVSRLPAGAESVIVCLLGYWVGPSPRNVASYAVVDDYHRVARELFVPVLQALEKDFPGRSFAFFTDSSPLREVEAARLAGLGFVGKNGQLICRGAGSRHFICEIVTDLPLTPGTPQPDGCGECRRCLRACPNGAIGPEGVIDRERCRSHITQKKGELTPWERENIRLGGLAWGCDICTDACPYNREAPLTDIPRFYEETTGILSEENCEEMVSRKAFGWRGVQVLRRNLAILAQGGLASNNTAAADPADRRETDESGNFTEGTV